MLISLMDSGFGRASIYLGRSQSGQCPDEADNEGHACRSSVYCIIISVRYCISSHHAIRCKTISNLRKGDL